MKVSTAINPKYVGKIRPSDPNYWDFNMTFRYFNIELCRIAKAIKMGFSITAPHEKVQHHRPRPNNPNYKTTYRVQANVKHVQFIGLDCDTKDERSTFDWWIENDLMVREYGMMYTTSSHTPENPKCRILIPMTEPLSSDDYRIVIRQIMDEYNTKEDVIIDKSCKDSSRLWFGSLGCDLRMPLVDGGVPTEFVRERYIKLWMDKQEAKRLAREAKKSRVRVDVMSGDSLVRYVSRAVENQLIALENANEGTGDRHDQLLKTSSSLYSLVKSPWAYDTGMLSGIEGKIIQAAKLNGYYDKYGESTVLRVIHDMEREAEPRDAPDKYIEKGDMVSFNFRGEAVSGVVEKVKKYDEGWFYKVGGKFYHEESVR